MINIQPIEKWNLEPSFELSVHSIFYTIQGEGPLTGHPAIFIRLAGCNLQCPKCDTDYTTGRKMMTPEAIAAEVRKLHPGPRLVVITGGEPFRQDIGLLCELLADSDYHVQIETNGTLGPITLPVNAWIVVSPKTGIVHRDIRALAVAWKYVLSARSIREDGLPDRVLDHACGPRGVARPDPDFPVGAIYVQPADEKDMVKNGENLAAAINSCMQHGYTLQMQVHKLIGLE